ncbi:MAG: flagellar protein G [Halanaeroarchaeum sp.]
MASVSSETLILFIASILVAASVAGTMTDGVNRLGNALSDMSDDVSEEIRSDIEIISDPSSDALYDQNNATLTLLLKNTGSSRLNPDPGNVDLLVDGTYHENVSTAVIDGETWQVGNVVRLDAESLSLASGDHRAVVIVDGAREVIRFRT